MGDEMMDRFDLAWDVLAKEGACDTRGGMEYCRVRMLWDSLGGELAVAMAFIRNAANSGPDTPAVQTVKDGAA